MNRLVTIFSLFKLVCFCCHHRFCNLKNVFERSKLNFKVFDKRDRSITHLTTVVMKNRVPACCVRLSNSKGITTPFHLILDYFNDSLGEPKGLFIDFGNHTTLAKHFSKIETKPSGQQKCLPISVKQV